MSKQKQTPLVSSARMSWWQATSIITTEDEKVIRNVCVNRLGAKPQRIRRWGDRRGWYLVVMDEEVKLKASVSHIEGGPARVSLYLMDYHSPSLEPIQSIEDLGRMLARRGPAPGPVLRALPWILVGLLGAAAIILLYMVVLSAMQVAAYT